MIVGRRLGLDCGHFTSQQEKYIELLRPLDYISYYHFIAPTLGMEEYCDKCADMKKIKRINAFLIERDIAEIS